MNSPSQKPHSPPFPQYTSSLNDNNKPNVINSNTNMINNKDNNSSSIKKRFDYKGIEIQKQNKNYHISFKDKITKRRLAEIVEVESFKEYNLTEEFPSSKQNDTVSCCCIV
jgi:hypothetical protein